MTRISEKERLEAAAERYEVLKYVLRDPLHTRNLGREDTLRELIDWLGKERDYVLQWRGKDGKGLVNDTIRPVDPWTHEANIFAHVIRHCENLLDKETNHGNER